jgi:hypothetical protein
MRCAVIMLCLLLFARASFADLPSTQPDFGPNVRIFDPSMPAETIQQQINEIFATQEAGQFNSNRYALLFMPGQYKLDVQVGFYTQVLGLGASPDDVTITGAVRSTARWMRRNNATCNFWRCAENLAVIPTVQGQTNIWAVSQGTALRRVHIKGNLNLWDGGWSSGGFLADSVVDGTVNSGSQQQWLSRNVEWGQWAGGNWNMVFVGAIEPPAGEWPDKPYTKIERTPIIAEKPYLAVDDRRRFVVHVPAVKRGSRGVSWRSKDSPPDRVLPIDEFFIAHSERDDAGTINAALESGKNMIFTPGIYHLRDSIHIRRAGTVLLGLGYATLIAENGSMPLDVYDVDGVRIAGLLLEAGAKQSGALLQIGADAMDHPSSRTDNNPIVLSDIFCRAGGAAPGAVSTFVAIDTNDVIADNLWLWRADHGDGAGWTTNPNLHGLIVNGNHVTIYGLFVEHCQGYQTIWNGEDGRVYLYQSEMPYDPPSQADWSHDGIRGYASYKVMDWVKTHEAWGLGVYCVFRQAPVVAESAIEAPEAARVKFHHIITRRLNPNNGSGIAHVLNQNGDAVIERDTARMN